MYPVSKLKGLNPTISLETSLQSVSAAGCLLSSGFVIDFEYIIHSFESCYSQHTVAAVQFAYFLILARGHLTIG